MRAVITGGGSGLGRALCLEAARRGAEVMVVDLDASTAEATAAQIVRAGGRAEAWTCDVSDGDAMLAMAEAILAEGPVDLLCNNAGVAVGGPFESVSLTNWEWIIGVNLWGVINGCHAFLPGMLERKQGAILNVASAAGLLSAPGMAPYNTTKAGVVSLTETLWAEVRHQGVQTTVLCPTFFQTKILERSRGPRTGHGMARKRMEQSAIQAPEVAAQALDDLAAGELYSLPMRDGHWLWRVKRVSPRLFHRIVSRLARERW